MEVSKYNKNKNKYNIIIFISFLIFSFLSISIFLNIKTFYGARDMAFHFRRAMELVQSIKSAHFLPLFSFNYFHGSAVMSMYPYFSIYPFALLIILTHSLINSYYIFVIFVLFCTMIISFLSSIKYSNSILVSYIFSVTYGTSSTMIFELFSNSDLGVLTSLAFLPLVIFGFIDMMSNPRNYLKFTSGIILMTFCQIPAVVITCLFVILWLLINIKKCNVLMVCSLIKSVLISILLTSIVWIPFLYVIKTNKIYSVTQKSLVGTPPKLFLEHISIIPIITIILSCFFLKSFNRWDKQMLGTSVLIMLISSKLMPWTYINNLPLIKLLNVFQYSFRFLIIPQILLCYLFAIVFAKMLNHIKLHKVLLMFFILFIIFLQLSTQFIILNKKTYHNTNMNINNYKSVRIASLNHKYDGYFVDNEKSMKYLIDGFYLNNDYYPKSSLSKAKYCHDNKIVYNKYHLLGLKHIGNNTFEFSNNLTIKNMSLPFVKYNNENIKLYSGKQLIPYKVNKNRLISLKNVRKGNHIIKFKYSPNLWLIGIKFVLFLIGLIGLFKYINNRKHTSIIKR